MVTLIEPPLPPSLPSPSNILWDVKGHQHARDQAFEYPAKHSHSKHCTIILQIML